MSFRVIRNVTFDAHDFLFTFHTNYASVLYRFRQIASYLLKVANYGRPM